MLADGNYRGRPVSAALGVSSKGNEQIAVQFAFTDPVGERLTWYGFFTDATFDRTIESLRACGWRGTDLSEFAAGSPLPEGFDQEVELVVKQEEYQGKVQARIAFVNSGGGLALKTALTADQARAFAAKLKGRIVAADKTAGRSVDAAPRRAVVKPPPEQPHPPLDHLEEQDPTQQVDAPF